MLLEATTVQTLMREINADLETPVSLYLKLRGDGAQEGHEDDDGHRKGERDLRQDDAAERVGEAQVPHDEVQRGDRDEGETQAVSVVAEASVCETGASEAAGAAGAAAA